MTPPPPDEAHRDAATHLVARAVGVQQQFEEVVAAVYLLAFPPDVW